MLSATDTLPVGGANRREGGEGEEEGVEGTGLLADTMKILNRKPIHENVSFEFVFG